MRLPIFDMPDEPDRLRDWLDEQIAGLELRELVLELRAVHGESAESRTLEEACGTHLASILNHGFKEVPQEVIQSLLTHPRLLLELQDRVALEGGEFWLTVPISAAHQSGVERGWQALQASLVSESSRMPEAGSPATDSPDREDPGGGTDPWGRRRGGRSVLRFISVVCVAAVLGVIVRQAFLTQAPSSPGWGWDRPGALTADLAAPEYLNHLADAAGEWFNKPRDSRAALEKRLTDFRHGCDTLIEAPHQPLKPADRDWLRERCRVWSGRFDEQLAALQRGDPVETVARSADETVTKLIQAIRQRAEELG